MKLSELQQAGIMLMSKPDIDQMYVKVSEGVMEQFNSGVFEYVQVGDAYYEAYKAADVDGMLTLIKVDVTQ